MITESQIIDLFPEGLTVSAGFKTTEGQTQRISGTLFHLFPLGIMVDSEVIATEHIQFLEAYD